MHKPVTPTQPLGPFYPIVKDLTKLIGHDEVASGEVIVINGKVTDRDERPKQLSVVEIWQACASGRYNHLDDSNPAPLDLNFHYWGRAITRSDGSFRFRSIKPGSYPAGHNWVRPPHIHFKVQHIERTELGDVRVNELVTQLYFDGEDLNSKDLILQRLSACERKLVVVPFSLNSRKELEGEFKIVLGG